MSKIFHVAVRRDNIRKVYILLKTVSSSYPKSALWRFILKAHSYYYVLSIKCKPKQNNRRCLEPFFFILFLIKLFHIRFSLLPSYQPYLKKVTNNLEHKYNFKSIFQIIKTFLVKMLIQLHFYSYCDFTFSAVKLYVFRALSMPDFRKGIDYNGLFHNCRCGPQM